MKQILLTLSLLFIAVPAHAFKGGSCSPSPIDGPHCKSDDGLTEFSLYDTRAHNADGYDGLNELTFCPKGQLKVNGYETKETDLGTATAVSSDYTMGVKDPHGKKAMVDAEVNFSLSEDAKDAWQALGGVTGRILYFGKTATLYIFGGDSKVVKEIALKCPPGP